MAILDVTVMNQIVTTVLLPSPHRHRTVTQELE